MEDNLFSVNGKVAVVTGAGGVLGGSMSKSLARAGVKVAALDIRQENLDATLNAITADGGEASGFVCNVLDVDSLQAAADSIVERWGRIDILVNCAGGNVPGATLAPDQSIFEMELDKWDRVIDLNQKGTVLPCIVFGRIMAQQKRGSIVNISSMATYSALTRVPGYSVAKTGINIFTKWLATEMAQKFGEGVRVNAIAPGFFIGDQNRAVLINPDGSLTDRSRRVLAKTPMGRFGDIGELNGAVQFLCSDAASFITGAILPIDGGFSAFSGV
jgi:NAD(P)-dependent dehydrogenase (short-subunit alcohol dehydrogenase family)